MAVGEIVLAAFIQVLFEKLASRELLNSVRREGIQTALEKWRGMLEEIKAVLADAEEKQTKESIQKWLEDLEDLAYDLDDVLDEIATEALRRKLKHQERLASIHKVRAFIPACLRPSTVLSDFRMKSKLDKITPRLQNLFERRSGLGLQKAATVAPARGSQRTETTSLIHEPCVHGRDEDKKAIMELLLNDQLSDTKFGVVPIVGMGGVGKTTLAQMVYNDETVEKHFDIKAWVCVSDNFDIMRVTKAILEFVASPSRDLKELDQVQVQLKKGLAGKKFLIVLDDVWNKNHGDWSKLKSPFIDGAQGSKVIVTTRDTDVAGMMGTIKYHQLKQLSDDDCWFVFSQHAFENLSMNECPNLVSIGRKIVAKCGGLPLAARTLGGLLRGKSEDCEKCTCLPPLGLLPKLAELHIQGMKAVENVPLEFYGLGCSNPFPSLEILSFEYMPEWQDWSPVGVDAEAQAFTRLSELSIKSCPKLLGKLPSNLPRLKTLEIMKCPQLVVEWLPSPTMPHGMRNTLPFDSLTWLSLSDVSIPCSFNSPEVADEACSPSSSLTSMRLENIQELTCLPSWFLQGMMGLQELTIRRCQNLTIFWQNDVRLQHLLPALRSLEIEKCPQLISLFEEEKEGQQQQYVRLPSTLRTLSIYDCDSLQSLPELMMLNNLEKLTVNYCSALTCLCPGAGLPSTLKDLFISRCEKLEAVLAEGMTINCPSLEKIIIRYCDNLKTLPDVIQNHDLRNLNRLVIKDCDNLESLPEGWFPTPNLRELFITGCKKLDAPPQSAYNKNNHLTSLQQLHIVSSPAAAGIASYVLKEGRSLTNLTELTISNIDNPPSEWGLHRLASLRELSLKNSSWVSFPEDGFSLPTSLIILRIKRFPNLEKLPSKVLQTLTSLEAFCIEACPMVTSIAELGLLTSLSKLLIHRCPNLASIAWLGLLPSLLELWIFDCSNLASFPDQGLPLSLLKLIIGSCPILKQRCEKKKGQYWPFIAHIPYVVIDDIFIL
ncbi:Disease resistance RPP13-like protein [Actinidia chinensis var. chinensis]|uniref:Disease resistance RPP13-like protein n=1 Tax=Actinidia chinensis var. chinensis TaxID=1590841 RepID=A0A2R6QKL5_ACTCC|nr:Disease resistance RPP13-like protein [Actinidia chinensis var. chinensis]